MKAFICALLMAGAVAWSSAPVMAGEKRYLENFNQNLATATSLTLLSAVTGVTYRIHGLELSTDTAGTYTLRCGASSTKGKWSLSNNGGFLVEYINVSKLCASGEGVFVDKPDNANLYGYIWYDKR